MQCIDKLSPSLTTEMFLQVLCEQCKPLHSDNITHTELHKSSGVVSVTCVFTRVSIAYLYVCTCSFSVCICLSLSHAQQVENWWALDGENCFKATYLTLKVMEDSHTKRTCLGETYICTLSVPTTVLYIMR